MDNRGRTNTLKSPYNSWRRGEHKCPPNQQKSPLWCPKNPLQSGTLIGPGIVWGGENQV